MDLLRSPSNGAGATTMASASAATLLPDLTPEALGPQLRKQRRRLGLTLDELAGRTNISKPYLSLIETGRVPNPPSDEKLRRLEQTLGFTPGELVTQAHLHRTPKDVRAVLAKLMQRTEDSGQRTDLKPEGKLSPQSSALSPISL